MRVSFRWYCPSCKEERPFSEPPPLYFARQGVCTRCETLVELTVEELEEAWERRRTYYGRNMGAVFSKDTTEH
jgi:hypothetical protein